MTLNRVDKLVLVAGGYSQAGPQRAVNEDHLATPEGVDPELLDRLGHLYAVADGMGGHTAGEQASALAVSTVMKAYYGHPSMDPGQALTEAIRQANAVVYRQAQSPETAGMGSTVVAAVVRGHDLYIAHVGDSRAYLIRGQVIKQITRDHSWVAEQVRDGVLSEEEARRHPHRHVLTRALGSEPEVEIDLSGEELRPGDAVLLCSDGLTDEVQDEEIRQIVAGNDPQKAATRLGELANQRGGSDDVTALVIGMMREPQLALVARPKPSRLAPIVGGVAIAVVILIALYWVLALRGPIVSTEVPPSSPIAVVEVSTHTPVPSVPSATPAVTPSPRAELATPTLEPSPTIPPTATPAPTAAPILLESQVFDTDVQKGPIRYKVKDGWGLAKHARIFGVEDRWEERVKWARKIAASHPAILVFPGDIRYIRKGGSIDVEPLNFGYMIGGQVESFSRDNFTAGFDLVLSAAKRYRIVFLDLDSVRRQPNSLINGETVRVFGYPKGENLLEVSLVDRYLEKEGRWQNWCFAPAKEGKLLWVYGKLNEWGFGGVEGVKHLMEGNYGEAIAAFGSWQRPCPTCDIIAFRMGEGEVYFWNEAEGLYAR